MMGSPFYYDVLFDDGPGDVVFHDCMWSGICTCCIQLLHQDSFYYINESPDLKAISQHNGPERNKPQDHQQQQQHRNDFNFLPDQVQHLNNHNQHQNSSNNSLSPSTNNSTSPSPDNALQSMSTSTSPRPHGLRHQLPTTTQLHQQPQPQHQTQLHQQHEQINDSERKPQDHHHNHHHNNHHHSHSSGRDDFNFLPDQVHHHRNSSNNSLSSSTNSTSSSPDNALQSMSTSTSPKPVRRREHNDSERKRRDHLRNAFNFLRDQVPRFKAINKKPPRIQILHEATLYVQRIMKESQELERRLDDERAKYEKLQQQQP